MSTIDRKAHPHCAALRDLSADEWVDMLDSYEAHGPRDAVIVADMRTGLIVDGWHSYQALKHLGIDPEPYVRLREFKDDTEIGEYVMHRQLARLNNTAAEQIAMTEAITGDPAAAKKSLRSIRHWNRIKRTGAAPLRDAVRQGQVSLESGAALAMLPESAQLDALRGGEHAVRAAVEQVRAAKAKAGPPPSVVKADPLAAAQDALAALNGVDLAAVLRRYNPAVVVPLPAASRSRPSEAAGTAKLNGGGAAEPDWQEFFATFNDATLVKDYIWFYILEDDRLRDKMLADFPELSDEWLARSVEPNYFPKHYPKIQLERLLDTMNEQLRLMPHNKLLRECVEGFCKGFHILERAAAKKELDAHLQSVARGESAAARQQ
jgi:hypothetical protein